MLAFPMDNGVFGARNNLKVTNGIVHFVFVDVVNYFLNIKLSADVFFHYLSMLKNRFVVLISSNHIPIFNVPSLVEKMVFSPVILESTNPVTETSFKYEMGGVNPDRLSAKHAVPKTSFFHRFGLGYCSAFMGASMVLFCKGVKNVLTHIAKPGLDCIFFDRRRFEYLFYGHSRSPFYAS